MRKDMQRWIKASFAKHFTDYIGTLLIDPFVLYMEGMPKHRTHTKYELPGQSPLTVPVDNFFELRIDGPVLRMISKDYWYVFVEVNILIATHIGNDLYKQDRHCGVIQSGFDRSIMISKIGDSGEDIGCMTLVMDKLARERLVVSNFGQIHPVIPILQSTVEGHYAANWSF